MNRQMVNVIVLVGLLWAMFAVATYVWLIPLQHNYDYLPRWVGAREMLFEGTDPFSYEITDAMLDEEGMPHFNARTFDYPATTTYILLPFWLLPHEISTSLWCGLQLVIFSTLPLVIYTRVYWKPRPLTLAAIVLLSVVGLQNSLTVYTLGQFTGFALACFVIAWWAISREHDTLAALALVGPTVRPDGLVIVGAFLAVLLWERRFKPVVIWAAVMAGLLVVSVLHVGWWVPDFVDRIREYHRIGESVWLPHGLLGAPVLEYAVTAGILGWAAWLVWDTRTLDSHLRLLWWLSVVIVVTLVVLPQTNDYTLVYLLLPIWLLLWIWRKSITTPLLFIWIPAATYAAMYAYDDSGRVTESYLWLNQFLTPLVVFGLLTVEWRRYNRARLSLAAAPERA